MIASAIAAVVCIFAYVKGSEFYAFALVIGSAACAVITVCEWGERKRVAKATGQTGVAGALSYLSPILSTVVTIVVIIATVWYFIG